ncbi:hypothetical protein N7468_005702 [Penicillium chermesinum]|uniref:Uncharacterized protein n=1 Tax=Penicillium chermesinum TaxID=63820 RepID=A0A9W9TN83_9EURO|nr:uncharacterized protein N7468_005702 [Penicillium chermesinum]KAJ5232746.1 hypothetical protein N7468_005702 [Penicillium chermesinum]
MCTLYFLEGVLNISLLSLESIFGGYALYAVHAKSMLTPYADESRLPPAARLPQIPTNRGNCELSCKANFLNQDSQNWVMIAFGDVISLLSFRFLGPAEMTHVQALSTTQESGVAIEVHRHHTRPLGPVILVLSVLSAPSAPWAS